MNKISKRIPWPVLIVSIYLISICIIFCLSLYNKKLISDEPLYFEIAKNFYRFKKIKFLDANYEYNTLLYSIIISPFFGIENIFLRNNLITLFNAFIMCSYVFPLFLIIKNRLSKKHVFLLLLISAIQPMLLYSHGYMQEIIFYPLVLWLIYFSLKYNNEFGKFKFIYSLLIGLLFSISYLCKEVGIIYIIVFLIIDLFEIFYQSVYEHKKVNLNSILCLLIKICVFLVIIIPLKEFVLPKSTLYDGRWKNLLIIFTDSRKFLFCLYSFFYYFSALLLSIWFYPFISSVLNIKSAFKNDRYLFSFVILITFTITLFMSTIIAPFEDIIYVQNNVIRCLIRYYSSVLLFYYLFMFKNFEMNCKSINSKKGLLVSVICISIFVIFFRGSRAINNVFIDHASISIYSYFIERPLYNCFGSYNFNYNITVFFINVIIGFIILLPLFLKIGNFKFKKTLCYSLIAYSTLSAVAGVYASRVSYKADNSEVKELIGYSEYLNKSSTNLLFITNYHSISTISNYFNIKIPTVYSNVENVENEISSKATSNRIQFSEIHFLTCRYNIPYDVQESFDCILLNKHNKFNKIKISTENSVLIKETSNYLLYRNLNKKEFVFDFL